MKKEKYFGLSHRIARWKINTKLENWLSYKADNSNLWKRIYLLYYNIFDKKYYSKGLEMAKIAIKDYGCERHVKNINAIIRDMIYCLHRFGYSFQDYCIYDFIHNKDIQYRASFVADKLRYHYCDILNSSDILQIMNNKYLCYEKYKKFFKREMIGCFTEKDENIFMEFISHNSKFIYKPIDEHSGHGIEIFEIANIDPIIFFKSKINNGPFVLEQLIEQGDETACIHPKSVNTCRILTFTIDKNVNVIGATWRVGSGGDIKDNAGSGGMYAAINSKNGIIETDAINFKGERFEKHPDSGLSFKGFQLPFWNEALAMIEDMATIIPGSTLIAWDIAYSKKGWVMVEANENGAWRIIQSNKNIGLKGLLHFYMDAYFYNRNRLG